MRLFLGLRVLASCAALVLTINFCMMMPAFAGRMAVVIGNSAYSGVSPLRNPVNDAERLSEKLRTLDFEVLELTDLSGDSLWDALDGFLDQAETAEIVLFFFSGHAFQLDNVNYLVPVDAQLTSVDSIQSQTWALNDILKRFERLRTNTVVMLDACRNNPLPPSMQTLSGMSGGLARIESGADTKVVFATQPHAVAYEGTGDTSYFTQALLDHIDTENQSLDDLIRNVRNQVRTETVRRQIPWSGGNLSEAFYFKRKAAPRNTLSAVDIENLLLNFPADQLPAILTKLADTVELDLSEIETRISTAQSQTNLLALIRGDQLDTSVFPDRTTEETVQESEVISGSSVLASPIPKRRPLLDLADLPQSESTVILADPETQAPRRLEPVAPIKRARTQAAIEVTRATSPQSILPVEPVSLRLTGTEFWLDDQASRSDLARLLPDLVGSAAFSSLSGQELRRATQAELDRLGCYRDRIDGIWGRNSRFALTSYYLAKGIFFEDLEPNNTLLRQLELEPNVVCTGVEARTPKRLARADVIGSQKKKTKAPRGTISYEAQEEIKKGGTFVGIRVR